VADGQTGFLVPPRDPVALADRLALLIANPRLRMEFGRRGEHRVRRLFTWEAVVDRLERVYRRVTA
jgi:glycosyltransferase involved in cell wall biosynthesis